MNANATGLPGAELPPPLADDTATAHHPLGPCPVCQDPILAGHRYALAVPSRQPVHLPCVARIPDGMGAAA